MQYRGISYPASPQSIETLETEIEVQYRGISYYIRRPVNAPIQMPKNLMYRGVAYESQPEITIASLPAFG